jgi:adenylate cyclase
MKNIVKYLTSTWSTVISAIMLLGVYAWNPSPVEILKLKTFDYIINILDKKNSKEIVLVEFGEKSVQKFGQWPFDRRDVANTIEELRQAGALVITVPILFSEKDRAGGDANLEKTLSSGGVVISQTPTVQRRTPDAVRRGFAAIGDDPKSWVYSWPGAVAPLRSFADVAEGVGVLAATPERDGVVRRLPMLVKIGDSLYPSLVLETLRALAGDPSYQIKTGSSGVEAVRIPQFPSISTDERGLIWTTWNNGFERIEATELIPEKIKNKIVILGLTIEGIGGIIATPIGENWAHEIQAQALQTLIDGTSISRLSIARLLEIVTLIVLLALLLYVVPKTSVSLTVPLYLLFVITTGYTSYYLFNNYLQLWDPSYIILSGSIIFGHLVFNNFAREFRLKQQIKKQFGTYLSPALVEKLQKNPELLRLGGETRELSIMFTDVRGFTTISEHYGLDVQGLMTFLKSSLHAYG